MRSAYNVFFALFCSLFLIACSGGGDIGGGDDGNNPTPAGISVELETTTDQIEAATPAIITAKVTDENGSPVSTLVSFSLNNDLYGTFTPGTGEVTTNGDGIATVTVNTASVNTGATITATITSGESNSINVTMAGDGGEAGGGAQVSLVLTDTNDMPIDSITTLTPGKLTATVAGITKPTIVTFSADIGDLPIKTAVTNDEGKATVDIYAGSALGAGEVTASLPTNEVGKTIVVVGATNVEMGSGSGDSFVKGDAQVSATDLSAGGTATVSVTIQDVEGNPFTQPVDVNFSSTCATKTPAQAVISSPVSSSNGVATSTYLAQGCVGEDQINVTANAGGISLSAVGIINILAADVGSIVFVSAEPENISILGTGGDESSTIKFKVLDENGNPVSNQDVSFTLNTDVGGVGLTPLIATTNNEGIVQTVVTSGTVSTSLRVTAVVENGAVPAITSQSKQLIVSTGIPDQDSFSLSAELLNAEGWNIDGTPVVITARMGDAFNNPVPDGTTISFTTEGGLIEDACQTVAGKCSVTWTSQLPRPTGETILAGDGSQNRNPQSGLIYDASLDVYGNFYGQKYGGRATITATAIGEESFPDLNGNGRFDADEMTAFSTGLDVTGQPFDLDDAFVDYNEDTVFNPQPDDQPAGQDGGELERLIDFNANAVFDTKDGLYNGVLCSSPAHAGCANGVDQAKSIFVRRSLVMVMSGSTAFATSADKIIIDDKDGSHEGGSINIIGKGSASVAFTISDLHNQQMPAGTVVKFSTSAGSIVSNAEYTWPSSNYNGGRDFVVTLKGEDEANSGVFLVEVETPNGTVTQVVSINVNII
ncbi:Ig-like domain-containing protein [Shewanella intestini]|uniref:Big-1 domain-containing protein n=1 Tax=Shewanella intestini TaxID=2017544 RepID=A0ABS5I4N2_9GAMM|nr:MULTISPECIES: invasin domain 3-containing protein [Shewanella]MBR9728979.1 hypothetical protein [Shewanella intestini]MRG36955.1 hypothetical protein [Shewanella sp. XMDDZSB0408]